MSVTLRVRSRQRCRAVDTRQLRRMVQWVLGELPGLVRGVIEVHLVSAHQMARLNERYLDHRGPTDVLAFDYAEDPDSAMSLAEIFVCVEQAVAHARRFRTSWQAELVRYIIHGLLHLHGFNDRTADARRRMKRVEDRLLRRVRRCFPLRRVRRIR